MPFRNLALLALAFCAADAVTPPAAVTKPTVTTSGKALKPVDGPDFVGELFGCLDHTITGTPAYLKNEGVQYFQVDHEKVKEITLTPGFASDGSACSTTFFVAVFSCLADRDCMVRSGVADAHAQLAADDWTSYSNSVSFKLCEKCSFKQNTRMYTKTLEATDAAITIPTSMFMGVFTAGCGVDVTATNVPTNVGPVKYVCGDYCPAQVGFSYN